MFKKTAKTLRPLECCPMCQVCQQEVLTFQEVSHGCQSFLHYYFHIFTEHHVCLILYKNTEAIPAQRGSQIKSLHQHYVKRTPLLTIISTYFLIHSGCIMVFNTKPALLIVLKMLDSKVWCDQEGYGYKKNNITTVHSDLSPEYLTPAGNRIPY